MGQHPFLHSFSTFFRAGITGKRKLQYTSTLTVHFDGSQELLWKKRKLVYGTMGKPQRQSPVADEKYP